jgi:integrase
VSVEKVVRSGTVKYRVRWREGTVNRAATFERRKDAEAHDRAVKVHKASGGLVNHRKGGVSLEDYAGEWWDAHAPTLNWRTLDVYSVQLDNRIVPLLGRFAVRDLRPLVIEDFIGQLRARGDGNASILKALAVLSAILSRAERDELIVRNPVPLVRKPSAKRVRTPTLLAPADVEAIRSVLLHGGAYKDGETVRHMQGDRHRDAALVSLLAYSGPRPESEGVTLTWDRVLKRNIVYRASKKKGAERTVKLLAPLAEDLTAWKVRSGRRSGLVFPASGGAWGDHDWRNWQRRVFKPACRAAGLPAETRARDLRGSFASLLIWSGMDVAQVAGQLGHTIQTCLRNYAQAFDEARHAERVDPDEAIRQARGETRSTRKVGT